MEWVEAVGRTVDEAVSEAMNALGETSRDAVEIRSSKTPRRVSLGLVGRMPGSR